ncbi:MAG: glutamine amidotransferase [Bradymonadia bacterium]
MWRELFDPEGEFNAARFVWLSDWSPWLLVAIAALAIGVVVLGWLNTAPLSKGRRRLLLSLRLGTLVVLGILFLQPGVRLENLSRVRNHVVFLVDASRSMALPGEGGMTRLASVKAFMQRHKGTLDTWSADHQIDLFAVDDRAQPVSEIEQLEATGDVTRLLSGLEDIGSRLKPEDLAAVVVVSDGADNGALGDGVDENGEVGGNVVEAVQRLGAPVHTIFTGPEEPPKDVAVAEVKYDDFAFVRNVVSIEGKITVTGYDNLVLPVTLRRGETVLGVRSLRVERGVSEYPFEFEFVPDKTGKAVFTLSVDIAPGEEITVNNQQQFVIRIIRDKIRVLQVVGRPSWDQRFLRKLLKNNPNVDLISFFILRTGTNLMLTPTSEMSLIPFPTRELFETQLGSFDLIIFQNFTYRGYHMRQYLPFIRDFVANGGGFVMIGGDQSFASGGYAGTPIAEFLPVSLPGGGKQVHTDEFTAALTEAGRTHPITALSLVPEDNEALWSKMPPLEGANHVSGVREDATVLLQHPSRTTGGQPFPVAVVREFGEGRVLAVTTDTTWQWAFQATADGGDNRHYYKFWGNTIRWLIKDPALNAVRVEADRDRYPLGAEASLVTRVVDQDFSPAADVDVTVEIERTSMGADGRLLTEVVHRHEGVTTKFGEVVVQFKPTADGAYSVRSTATLSGGEAFDTDVFVVAADPVELRRTDARRETMAALASAGGGQGLDLDDDLADLNRVEPRIIKVNRRRDVPLWSSAWWLVLGVLLPSLEWFYRRRWGLM